MTVDQLLANITSDELVEWMAFQRIEPFGPCRADLHSGMIAATVANVNLKEGAKPLGPQDFFPELEN